MRVSSKNLAQKLLLLISIFAIKSCTFWWSPIQKVQLKIMHSDTQYFVNSCTAFPNKKKPIEKKPIVIT